MKDLTRVVVHANEQGFCDYMAEYNGDTLVRELYLDYAEDGSLIKTTSTKDIWYDYYHEDNYYEISRIFDRNRRY